MIPMCILNDDLLGFEFTFGLRDFSPSSVVHYVSPQADNHYAPPPVTTVSSVQAQDTNQPERKPITYDIIEGHIFPTPDQVHPNDAIFKVVKAEIHREHSDDLTNANSESDRASSISSYCEQEEGWNESVSAVTDESSLETYSTSGTDEEGSVDENPEEEFTGDMKPSKVSINDDVVVAGTSATSTSVKPLPKVVGCVSNPNLATMKFTNAGKVWLWDRPEDILVIKEDGRIIDPASNTVKKRHQKSYQQQVKLSASKLYDYFFSKKPNSAGNKGNWGTTSLDRRAVMNASQAKRDFHVSLSSYDILSSDEK